MNKINDEDLWNDIKKKKEEITQINVDKIYNKFTFHLFKSMIDDAD